jgi:hypothetical protein
VPKIVADGFSMMIYTRGEQGHLPHAHVWRGDDEAVFLLTPQVALRERSGMKANDLRRAQRAVADHRDELLAMWETYHAEKR